MMKAVGTKMTRNKSSVIKKLMKKIKPKKHGNKQHRVASNVQWVHETKDLPPPVVMWLCHGCQKPQDYRLSACVKKVRQFGVVTNFYFCRKCWRLNAKKKK